jgi:hypothetical protein
MNKLCRNGAILVMSILALAQTVRSDGQPKSRVLTFADRVAYQYAIEEIYWRHRIWPKENRGAKPALGLKAHRLLALAALFVSACIPFASAVGPPFLFLRKQIRCGYD